MSGHFIIPCNDSNDPVFEQRSSSVNPPFRDGGVSYMIQDRTVGLWTAFILPYDTEECFRAGNRASGPDFGRTATGKASKSAQHRSESLCAGLWAPCRIFWAGFGPAFGPASGPNPARNRRFLAGSLKVFGALTAQPSFSNALRPVNPPLRDRGVSRYDSRSHGRAPDCPHFTLCRGRKVGFRAGFRPDSSGKRIKIGIPTGPKAGRRVDFEVSPIRVRPKSSPEGRFPVRENYCVT
jgi:hypothetical protein